MYPINNIINKYLHKKLPVSFLVIFYVNKSVRAFRNKYWINFSRHNKKERLYYPNKSSTIKKVTRNGGPKNNKSDDVCRREQTVHERSMRDRTSTRGDPLDTARYIRARFSQRKLVRGSEDKGALCARIPLSSEGGLTGLNSMHESALEKVAGSPRGRMVPRVCETA